MSSLVVSLLLASLAGTGQVQTLTGKVLQTGHVLEDVSSDVAPGKRYVLYLPTGFDATKPTPILYLMDPRGRARVPARLFQAAAERYGYILISSYTTSSDGPIDPNIVALQAMWDDANRWFTLDPNRNYLAGFSGTARTASRLADIQPLITGIISAGAGFDDTVRPSAKTPFLFFGAVGEVDYNFHEIQTLEHVLADLNLPHRIERFQGPHSWMPAEVAMRAIEWFELRAIQAKTRPYDAALVDAWWTRDGARAQTQLEEGRILDAARQYAAMARDYAGLVNTAPTALAARRIAEAPSAKSQLRERRSASRDSLDWVMARMRAIAEAFPTDEVFPVVPASDLVLTLELASLKRTAAGPNPDAALEAQRRLNQLEVQLGFYLPSDALARADFSRAGYYLSVAMQITDDSPVSWYLSAQRSARLNAPKDAFASLQHAVDSGFRAVAMIEADPSFERWRMNPEYVALVEALRRAGDVLDPLTVDRPPVPIRR